MYRKMDRKNGGGNIKVTFARDGENAYALFLDMKKKICKAVPFESDGDSRLEKFPVSVSEEDMYVLEDGKGRRMAYFIRDTENHPAAFFTASLKKIEIFPRLDPALYMDKEKTILLPIPKKTRFAGFAGHFKNPKKNSLHTFLSTESETIFHYDEKNLDFPRIVFSDHERITLFFPQTKEMRSFEVENRSLEITGGGDIWIFPCLIPFGKNLYASVAKNAKLFSVQIFREENGFLEHLNRFTGDRERYPFVGFLANGKIVISGRNDWNVVYNDDYSFVGMEKEGEFVFTPVKGMTIPIDYENSSVGTCTYDHPDFYINDEGALVAKAEYEDGVKSVIVGKEGITQRIRGPEEIGMRNESDQKISVRGNYVFLRGRRAGYTDPKTGKFEIAKVLPEGYGFVPVENGHERGFPDSKWIAADNKGKVAFFRFDFDKESGLYAKKEEEFDLKEILEPERLLMEEEDFEDARFVVERAYVGHGNAVRVAGDARNVSAPFDDLRFIPAEKGYVPAYKVERTGEDGQTLYENFGYMETKKEFEKKDIYSSIATIYETPKSLGGVLHVLDEEKNAWVEIPTAFSPEASSGVVINAGGEGYVVMEEVFDPVTDEASKIRVFAIDGGGTRLTDDVFLHDSNMAFLDGESVTRRNIELDDVFTLPLYGKDFDERGICLVIANAIEDEEGIKSLFFMLENGKCDVVVGRRMRKDARLQELIGVWKGDDGEKFLVSHDFANGYVYPARRDADSIYYHIRYKVQSVTDTSRFFGVYAPILRLVDVPEKKFHSIVRKNRVFSKSVLLSLTGEERKHFIEKFIDKAKRTARKGVENELER